MQDSPSINSLSPFSPHPGDSNPQNTHNPGEPSDVKGPHTSSPPQPAPKPPSRSTKRHNKAATKSQKAAQLAKQELRSKLKEDWSWPPAPGTPCWHQVLNLPTDESAWQERGEGFETDSSPGEINFRDPYQYESPDAVTAPARAAHRAELKKRNRRQVLLEEMGWNDGLKYFVERRNAWSGARERQIDLSTPARNGTVTSSRCDGCVADRDVTSKRNAAYAPPDASKSLKAEPLERILDTPSLQSLPDPSLNLTVVPYAPPIFPPDNAVRASITPATYPSIYSKIVIQGLTPTVPINLHDVVGALVKGWKDNDEWPPKSEAERVVKVEGADVLEGLGESMSNGMKKGVRGGMGKVKRALHLSGRLEGDDENGDIGMNEAPNDVR